MLSNVALYSLPRLVPMVELSVPVISLVSKVLMKIISFLFSNQKELCIRAYECDRVVVLGKGQGSVGVSSLIVGGLKANQMFTGPEMTHGDPSLVKTAPDWERWLWGQTWQGGSRPSLRKESTWWGEPISGIHVYYHYPWWFLHYYYHYHYPH